MKRKKDPGGSSDLSRLKDRAAGFFAGREWKSALKTLLEARELAPRDKYIARKIGEVYQRLGMVDQAIDAYKQAAKLYAADGFDYKAISVNKIVLSLNPGDREVQEELKTLYSQRQGKRLFNPEHGDLAETSGPSRAVGVYLDRVSKETLLWIPLISELPEEELSRVVESMVRRMRRVNVMKRVKYTHQGSSKSAYTRDLSRGGVYLRTRDVVPPETELELEINLESEDNFLVVRGKVVRESQDRDQRGFGVRFEQSGQAQALDRIEIFVLAELENQSFERLKANPQDENALYDLAGIARERRDFGLAEQYLRRITEFKSPSVAHGFLAEVVLHRALETGDKALYREATELFSIALKTGHDHGLESAQETLMARISSIQDSQIEPPAEQEDPELARLEQELQECRDSIQSHRVRLLQEEARAKELEAAIEDRRDRKKQLE